MIEIKQKSEGDVLLALVIRGSAQDLWNLAKVLVRASDSGRETKKIEGLKLKVVREDP